MESHYITIFMGSCFVYLWGYNVLHIYEGQCFAYLWGITMSCIFMEDDNMSFIFMDMILYNI